MQITIGDYRIYADGYIPIPEENAVQFYREKSDLDYMAPIKVSADSLSDFGKELFCRY